MADAAVRSHSDAWVSADEEHKNHGKGVRLWVRSNDTTNGRRAFVSFAKPHPHNDNLVVVGATLKLWLRGSWSGTQEVTAQRVTETWKENRITWANQPDITAVGEATETVTNGDDRDALEIDVTDIMQDAASGGDWFGFCLKLDDDNLRAFYSSDAPQDPFHPKLEVEWGVPPYPPTNLSPAGNGVISIANPVLSWRFTDHRQDTTQGSSQVQISTSTDFSSTVYDSTKQTNTLHRWPLAGEYNVPAGVTRYWRVKVWDDADNPSGWSDTARFQRIAKGTITIVNPGISETVDDLTPSIEWTFSGDQDRVRLRLLEIKADATTVERFQYATQKNTIDHLTIPRRNKHPIIKTGHDYRVQLYIWDTEDRISTPKDPAYAFAQRNFTYDRDGSPDPVSTLTADLFGPGVTLTWERASTPDWFCLRVDDEEVLHRIEPVDVATVTPGEYRMTYWESVPRTAHTYEVEAVEVIGGHSVHSANNDFAIKTTQPTGIWLIDDDADDAVLIDANAETPDLSIGESATTYNPVGNRRPVRFTDAIRGYEGTFGGQVATSAARDTFLDLKGRDKELRAVIANLNIPIWLEEVSAAPVPIPDTERYQVSFAFFQSGEYFDIS